MDFKEMQEFKMFVDALNGDPLNFQLASPSPVCSPHVSFNNNEEPETYGGDQNFVEFNMNDLEALLDDNNVPTYSPMSISQELNLTPSKLEAMLNNNLFEDSLEVNNALNASASNVWVEEEVEVPVEQASSPSPQDKNFLLIKIPEHFQEFNSFNNLPVIQLKPNTIKEIEKAATGHNGVYLSMPKDVEPEPTETINIIRRKPLQIIQTIVPVEKLKSKVEEVKINKRKQQFKLTREDGVMFFSSSPEPEEKRARFDADKWFASYMPKPVAEIVKKPPLDESNRCRGCKKVFKNLANHNCKKLETDGSVREGKEPMICASCNKKYKSKRGLLNHFKKCDQSKVFEDKLYVNSETDEAMDEFEMEVEEPTTPREAPVIDIISVEILPQLDNVAEMEIEEFLDEAFLEVEQKREEIENKMEFVEEPEELEDVEQKEVEEEEIPVLSAEEVVKTLKVESRSNKRKSAPKKKKTAAKKQKVENSSVKTEKLHSASAPAVDFNDCSIPIQEAIVKKGDPSGDKQQNRALKSVKKQTLKLLKPSKKITRLVLKVVPMLTRSAKKMMT